MSTCDSQEKKQNICYFGFDEEEQKWNDYVSILDLRVF